MSWIFVCFSWFICFFIWFILIFPCVSTRWCTWFFKFSKFLYVLSRCRKWFWVKSCPFLLMWLGDVMIFFRFSHVPTRYRKFFWAKSWPFVHVTRWCNDFFRFFQVLHIIWLGVAMILSKVLDLSYNSTRCNILSKVLIFLTISWIF